ncbi:MAG: amino acid adenylation domain-containing protein, partial [bacterium]|nr:amino acid adenylation domain-containing protein [bacterium]
MIINRFEKQVERFPDNVAVISEEHSLTYSSLNVRVNRVAREITAQSGASAASSGDGMVSLMFEHGLDMIVGIIAVLKAGKAYVPLDISYPQKRLLYMLGHSGAAMVLTNDKNLPPAEALANQSGGDVKVLSIDKADSNQSGANISREVTADRPAYILYTSGSTGNPKGVVQSHGNLLYFIDGWSMKFSLTPSDHISLFASLSHDGAIPDIFGALLNGAALYPYDIKKNADLTKLTQWLLNENITIWHSVPTFYRYYIQALKGKAEFPCLRFIVLGGEEVRTHDVTLFKAYFFHSKFANIYGQTESTVNSIWTLSSEDPFKKVIIGEPLGETDIFLVDESGGSVEDVGVGEIVIANDHIALGYWKDEENTKKVFTSDSEVGRLYWTGDIGRLSADGNISIIGRKDLQVKIRGFRVETGEIESVLLKHPAVKEAVVVTKEDENIDNYLSGYIVPLKEGAIPVNPPSSAELKELLSQELPDYMVPVFFTILDEMPLTPGGKIDRSQLPEPTKELQPEVKFEAPTNEVEAGMVEIWQEILGTETISINSSFFDLGGHSLLVIIMLSKIHKAFNVELELRQVFDNPTIMQFAELITASGQSIFIAIEAVEKKRFYMMSSVQKRLYVLHQMDPESIGYNMVSTMMLEGEPERERLNDTFL